MNHNYATEAIDKLFLELSQFTTAKTARELELEARSEDRLRQSVLDASQAHHVLDVIGIPRASDDTDSNETTTLTLLGRMRLAQDMVEAKQHRIDAIENTTRSILNWCNQSDGTPDGQVLHEIEQIIMNHIGI